MKWKDLLTYSMNCCNCLGLTTFREKELGGLEEMEEEKSSHKHQEDNSPNGNVEISPAPIISFRAARWSRDVTRGKVCITGIMREETPGNERPNKLPYRPPYR